MLKKSLCIILVISFTLFAQTDVVLKTAYNLGYEHGKIDGKKDASALWIIAGTFCIGPALAYFYVGEVPAEIIIGQTADYAQGYNEGYIKAKRWRQVFYSGIGFAISATAGCISGLSEASSGSY